MAALFHRCAGVALWVALAVSVQAQTQGRQVLPGHVPAVVARLKPVGDLPETNRLNLAIGLPLRHQDALNRFLRDLYDPASPRYRHFLKPKEFADQFGPSQGDYQALLGFAKARHWQILRTHPNRVLLDVAASTAEVREVFHVNMKLYRHPSEARTFYAPDAEPSIALGVPLLRINGLDNYVLPRPGLGNAVRSGDRSAAQTLNGSGPGGSYLGIDFRAAYAPGVTLDGAGQAVALVEFDSYFTNDILAYEKLAGIAPVAITNVIIDGLQGRPGSGEEEVATDIELAMGMAPGLSQILVYEAPYDYSSVNNDLLNQIAVDDLAYQVSCSWFFLIDSVTDQIFQEMAAQGQSFFNAAGDSGAYYADMGAKEGDPFITVVGGSVLFTSGPGGAWQSEETWSPGGGGISATYRIPYWQQSVNMSANQGSTVWRNVPDVAAAAEGAIVTYDNGLTNTLSGTSCSAPLWAGFMALVNQQAAQNGQPPVGFLNPAIYGLGQSSLYRSCFHDITIGGNRNAGSPIKFLAKPGFDLCTGWGTPAGQALIDALAPPDSLVVLPAGGLALALTNNSTAAGALDTLVLTNGGAASVNWSLGAAPSWVQFSASNGVVPPGSATNLMVTTSPGATNLAVGGYAVDVALSNLTAGVAHDVPIFLALSDPLILTPATGMAVSGPVGGPFNVSSQIISLSNAAAASLDWTVNSGSAYLEVAPGSGTLAPGQVASVTATLSPAVSNLLINAASGEVAFADLSTGFTQNWPFTLAVGNGGFESGDFSDWVFAGNISANGVLGTPLYLSYVHSGAFAAIFGEPSTLATLGQSLPTTANQLYLISFWLNNPVGGNPNELKATWDGNTLFDQTNMPKFSWTNMDFVASASSNATTLEFFFQNKPDAFGFDDVSVTAIVPPAFASVAASNGAMLFNWSAMPGFSYQLQYTTNLDAPLWINSGGPMVATNGAVAASNTMPADPQRFYRVVLSLP
jgi:subtilase family serine protease